jgi:hypothetical protein
LASIPGLHKGLKIPAQYTQGAASSTPRGGGGGVNSRSC